MIRFIIYILLFSNLYSQCEGDTNGNGTVDIVDIISTVNIILDGETECESIECADNLVGHWVGTTMDGDYVDEQSCGADDFIGEDNSFFHFIVYDDFTYYQYYDFYGNITLDTIGVLQCTSSGIVLCPCVDDYIDCQDDSYCNEYDIMYIDGNDMTLIHHLTGDGNCDHLATMYFTKQED